MKGRDQLAASMKEREAQLSALKYQKESWGAGVEHHFQEFNEPYAPS